MSNSNTNKNDWSTCPPGTLTKMAGQEKARQRRVFLVKAGVAVTSIAAISTLGIWSLDKHNTEPDFGGITCAKLRQLAPLYIGKTLESKLYQQITAHIEQCPACRAYIKSSGGV